MEKNTRRNELVDSIVRNHMIWSMGAGVIPVPLVDFLAVGAIQIDMVRQISRAFDIDYKESEGKTLITALTGAGLARMGASLIKSIPGIGSVLGGASSAVLSGASTFAVGQVFKKHFETGGTFLDFDLGRLKKYYDEQFEKGKGQATDIRKKKKGKDTDHEEAEIVDTTPDLPDDIISRLRELDQLRKAGVINEEEYSKLKAKLIS